MGGLSRNNRFNVLGYNHVNITINTIIVMKDGISIRALHIKRAFLNGFPKLFNSLFTRFLYTGSNITLDN